ncbi:hypothetical protein D3C79_941480 [compost metagenome]
MQQRTEQARRGSGKLLHKIGARGNSWRGRVITDYPGITHHSGYLLVQLIAIGDDQNARLRVMLQQPLGDQHHQNALATALGMPDNPTLFTSNPLLRGLHCSVLMRARHLLDTCIEDDEVANQIE